MGFDISYHPISEQEMKAWYFDLDIKLIKDGDDSVIKKLATEHHMEDFYFEKYKDILIGPNDLGELFDKSEGFITAVIEGFFRTYYYTRGTAFSFLIEEKPVYEKYTKKWNEILDNLNGKQVFNRITENYTSGVYISVEGVVSLLEDYETNDEVKKDINQFYAQNLPVFIKALKDARDLKTGLLEATEVVEPDPLDLNKTHSYSNLFNCDKEGAFIYQDTVTKQLQPILTQTPKKSFWKKLFGK